MADNAVEQTLQHLVTVDYGVGLVRGKRLKPEAHGNTQAIRATFSINLM